VTKNSNGIARRKGRQCSEKGLPSTLCSCAHELTSVSLRRAGRVCEEECAREQQAPRYTCTLLTTFHQFYFILFYFISLLHLLSLSLLVTLLGSPFAFKFPANFQFSLPNRQFVRQVHARPSAKSTGQAQPSGPSQCQSVAPNWRPIGRPNIKVDTFCLLRRRATLEAAKRCP